MEETLPIDEVRRLDAAIWQSFEGQVAALPQVATEKQTEYEALHQNLRRHIVTAQEEGSLPYGLDADRTAASVAATIIGLRTMALINPAHYTPEFLRSVVDDVIGRLAAEPASAHANASATS